MDIDPDGKIIYIANEDDSMVTIMELGSGEVLSEVPVGVEPEGMAVSPDNKLTAATSESTSMAHIIDNETHQLVANVLVDSRPREAKWTKDGKELWVSSEIGGTVSVIDPTNWAITDKIHFEVPGLRPEQLQPVGMDFVKDESLVMVPLGPSNRVAVIDTAKKEVVDYILVGQRPWHGEPSADGTKYYVANGLTNDMTVIDLDSLKAVKSVPVGRLPWGVAVMPGKPGA
jgi:PQQ-dependent catabolism-associated beta-propeller protein